VALLSGFMLRSRISRRVVVLSAGYYDLLHFDCLAPVQPDLNRKRFA
jgi:hypothetical protein